MVDKMCHDTKDDMRRMDQVNFVELLLMARGRHVVITCSKSATFIIRYCYNGVLHLCQKGRDNMIKELYQGTCKGAKSYNVRLTLLFSGKRPTPLLRQWQTTFLMPRSCMICGVHTSRAHKKQLERLQKIKFFTAD